MKPSGSSSTYIAALLVCVSLSACDWVDSTGSNESMPVAVTEVFLDDMPAGDVITLNEQGVALIATSRTDPSAQTQTFEWSDEPVAEGRLPACETQNGFDTELAAESLGDACLSDTDCEFSLELVDPEDDSGQASFEVRVPALKAPVGLVHELRITDELGNTETNQRTFCLIAINEAPLAVDDTFVVTEGEVLEVSADTVNLLSNDSDDEDVSNSPLVVLPEAAQLPAFAAVFELGEDGSFTYQSSLTGLSEDQVDQFDYQLSDGLFTSIATATIRIVARNQAPQQIADIPPLAATEGVAFITDLSELFVDPEDGQISFSLATETPLAQGSGLVLSQDGVLSGIPTQADVGSYALIVVVSDGGLTTEASISLDVDAAPTQITNSRPVFVPQTVFSQSVAAGTRILPIRPQFTDDDGDLLTYSMSGNGILPAGVTINRATGIISGRSAEVGIYRGLRVRATDPSGAFALSTAFSLTITSTATVVQ